jgi:probable RNA-binding protein EIF1AD
MSRVTRLKHVKREEEADDFDLPTENQQIVRVVSSKGNNLHEVEPANDSENFLVSMPTKFRKNVWVKRGSYIIVENISEGEKVKAEIVRVLTAEHQKEFSKEGVWPKKFTKKREHSSEDEEDDTKLQRNPNHRAFDGDSDDSSSSEEESEDEAA